MDYLYPILLSIKKRALSLIVLITYDVRDMSVHTIDYGYSKASRVQLFSTWERYVAMLCEL